MPLRRTLVRAAVIIFPFVLTLVLLDQWPYLSERFSRGQVLGRDAYNFWVAGRLAIEGRIAEIYDPAAFGAAVKALLGPGAGLHVFPYPPPALLAVAPFGLLPYSVSLALWSLIGAGAFLLAVAAPRAGRTEILLALAAPMTLVNLALGQNGLLSAALFIGGLRLAASRPVLAGLLIGLLIYKPFLGLLLPVALIFSRRWAVVASAGATVVVLCALPLLLWGPEVWRVYIEVTAPYQRLLLEQGTGLAQFMKPSVFMSLRLLGADLATSYLAQLLCVILVLAFGLAYLWHRRRAEADGQTIAVIALASVLLVPYVHIYDLTIVAGAQILMLRQPSGDRVLLPAQAVLFGLLWMIPLAGLMLHLAGLPVAPLVLIAALIMLVRLDPVAPGPR
jgi:hypothetical protein